MPRLQEPKMQNILSLTILLFTFPISSRAGWFSDTPQPSKIYLDWTVPLNNVLQNGEASDKDFTFLHSYNSKSKDGSKSAFPNIFYSTDLLVSDLTKLFQITHLLDKNGLVESPLDLSFEVMINEHDHFPGYRLGDVFYPFKGNVSVPDEPLESLRKHISRIYVNLKNSSSDCPKAKSYPEYKRKYPMEYDSKWGISIPKYSKRVANKMLGKTDNSVKVGVIYDEHQLGCYNLAAQLKHADLLVINVNFEVASKFPLTYNQLKDYLDGILNRHRKNFLNEIVANPNDIKITLQLNLGAPSYAKLIKHLYDPEAEDLFTEIVEDSRIGYYSYLNKFARKWAKEGKSDLILSVSPVLNISLGEWDTGINEGGWSMPYLHMQEVDVTPCQLRTMLGQTGSQFSSMVVSEYTWNTFARYANKMTATGCPKAIHPPVKPPPVYLLFTSGIGGMWKETEEHFRILLQEHQNIYGWHLTHLIFSGEDIRRSVYENSDNCILDEVTIPNQGIPPFAMEMKEKYKIGCLVEFRADSSAEKETAWFEDTTIQSCNHLWNLSSVIIWQFDVAWNWGLDDQLSFRVDGSSGIKSAIIRASVARKRFLKEFPGKDVIFQINVLPIEYDELIQKEAQKNYYNGVNLCNWLFVQLHNLYDGIQAWAGIHKVKVIFGPAYHFQEAIRGLWTLPEGNGNPTQYDKNSCLKMITS